MDHPQSNSLTLSGVHHSARPTWKLKETVEFYRDTLGLKLLHCVSARGWGPDEHPDFLHFFFDSGQGSTIAFFHYLGTQQPDHLVHRPRYDSDAVHTAWQVSSREELLAWKARLAKRGVKVMYHIEHEVIESIYFRDPNGFLLEITLPLREFLALDSRDAELTLQAAIEREQELLDAGGCLDNIDTVWERKGSKIAAMLGESG